MDIVHRDGVTSGIPPHPRTKLVREALSAQSPLRLLLDCSRPDPFQSTPQYTCQAMGQTPLRRHRSAKGAGVLDRSSATFSAQFPYASTICG
jgi:hypothetical protein